MNPIEASQVRRRPISQPDQRPHAPSPIHPEDDQFDPEKDKIWREQRGLPKRNYGDDNPNQPPRGAEEVDYSFGKNVD
ncbi:MAG: hypothetical protein HYV33_02935 [Candidatus Kerfeldbacteria bacterium]|nr:hypothetical protein [Candidatus Kerfeldbacteria bacterium]